MGHCQNVILNQNGKWVIDKISFCSKLDHVLLVLM